MSIISIAQSPIASIASRNHASVGASTFFGGLTFVRTVEPAPMATIGCSFNCVKGSRQITATGTSRCSAASRKRRASAPTSGGCTR
ncbi:MAG: hypothetical protein EA377_04475 [Phycisphaerales bacterium]|nr:MAG: hypothetical protein EA377_04475 [Phycisphaerales bacterium]